MIWVSSDWHLDHQSIIKHCNRPFVSKEEMNDKIISVTNELVKPNDTFLFLGDLCVPRLNREDTDGYCVKVQEFLQRIKCKNFIWISGNHDKLYVIKHKHKIKNIKLWKNFIYGKICLDCNALNLESAEYCYTCRREHFENNYNIHPYGYDFKITKQIVSENKLSEDLLNKAVVLSHYSFRVWNKSHHKASYNLYGHSHGNLKGLYNSVDVGWDLWQRPLSLKELLQDIIPSQIGRAHV